MILSLLAFQQDELKCAPNLLRDPRRAQPRIVHQDVDAPPDLDGDLGDPLDHGKVVRHVELQRLALGRRKMLDLCGITGGRDDAVAPGKDDLRESLAKAGGRACGGCVGRCAGKAVSREYAPVINHTSWGLMFLRTGR